MWQVAHKFRGMKYAKYAKQRMIFEEWEYNCEVSKPEAGVLI